jgi:predicted HicB family RNase H-like nuclease
MDKTESDQLQLGVRVDAKIVIDCKVLAVRQRRGLNKLVEEALKDLLKKYKA